jgi:hypothetical protein
VEESATQETREVLRAVGGSVGTVWVVRGKVGSLVDVEVWVGVWKSMISMVTVEVG